MATSSIGIRIERGKCCLATEEEKEHGDSEGLSSSSGSDSLKPGG